MVLGSGRAPEILDDRRLAEFISLEQNVFEKYSRTLSSNTTM